MSLYKAATSGIKHLKIGPYGLKVSNDVLTNIGILSQVRTSKHWNPKFKKLRSQKVIKVNLPDFEQINKKQHELSAEEVRSKMKENGLFPRRPWIERPLYFSCTGDVFEPYVPPEGDGKVSVISTAGAKQALQFIEKKSKSMLAVRKIRKFEDEFEVDIFLKEAIDIYEKAHEAITTKDEDNILKYSTERAYPEILHNIQNKTIKWKMIKEVERPRLVHARSTDVISKDNVFSQLTVRFHTEQILAVYDRFGRLMHGSEILAKDVLEYVVFEKHLSNKYGSWRIHAKIIPDWMPPKDNMLKTFRLELSPPVETLPEPENKDTINPPSDSQQLAAV